MSFLGSIFGGNGSNFQAGSAPVTNALTNQQFQTSAGQAQQAINAQQGLVGQLTQANGVGNQSQVYAQQQALAQQLQGLANGQGPNPALAQLAQTTGQNVNQTSALMAGQRGAGSNAGLIARQAAQQGAATQQQAVGQAATLQAQQQLAYTNALQQQQAALANTAGQQVGEFQNANSNLGQQTQAEQAQILSGINAQNQSNISNAQQQNEANSRIAAVNAGTQGQVAQGLLGGIGSAATTLLAEGGSVGQVANLKENYKGKSKLGHRLYAKGGKIDALLSPGERYLSPSEVEKVVDGKKSPMKAGEHIPGKPVVGGAKNSYANDIVAKKVAKGGVVLPRSVTKSDNPDKNSREFLAETLRKKGKK